MEKELKRKLTGAAIALLIAVLSVFVVGKYVVSMDAHRETIESLDEKRNNVLELTAASAAVSTAITFLPGEAATPIAEKLTDLINYFLVVICAIYLEKYLVTITGYAAFTYLIPAACVLFTVYLFTEQETLKELAKKLALFGLAIFLIVPASVKISNLIEATYNVSIEETLEAAKDATHEIEEEAAAEAEEEGFVSGIISKVQEGVAVVTELPKKVEVMLNRLIEALAVLLVTSCVIPIMVLFFFLWITKMILGLDFDIPTKLPKLKMKGKAAEK